jgi:hypothetical protein
MQVAVRFEAQLLNQDKDALASDGHVLVVGAREE